MSRTKHLSAPVELKDDSDSGGVVARFSIFDIEDRDGDIVRASAFKDGQSVPMVWAHDWTTPIGKGVIRVDKDHARFEGSFLTTHAAQEARKSVREMGDLQEWSFGFRVTDFQKNAEIAGLDITGAEVFEVSPVLVGANQETATVAVKSAARDDEDERIRAIVRDELAKSSRNADEPPTEEPPADAEKEARTQLEHARLAWELAELERGK